ncbi:MAG: NAD(P)-dependent oxidoreductase [Candidatus Bipolaricaulota bacterium]
MNQGWPQAFGSERELDDFLTRPRPALVESAAEFAGGLLVLGVGGKMGHTLARMARRALDEAGLRARVVGVSRFSDSSVSAALQADGIETISCDLMDPRAVARLPELSNVVFMAGRKFGSSGGEARTWAVNAYVPGIVASRFPSCRLLAFSTGNVYPFVEPGSGGAGEATPPGPIGEYAQSCLGRERVFEHFCAEQGTKTILIRLNYAVELRYGVLVDLAQSVWRGEPIDLAMSHVNVIWQGDAVDMILRALPHADSPIAYLNVTGPETVSIRDAAEGLGRRLGRAPLFSGRERGTALLANVDKACHLLGRPEVDVERMLDWIAAWTRSGGRTLGKPTHFSEREGRF